MSEPTSDAVKAPLHKQLLGALTGAVIAVVLYQAYAFTSSTLQAVVWPTKTLTDGQSNSSPAPIYRTRAVLAQLTQFADQATSSASASPSSSVESMKESMTPVPEQEEIPAIAEEPHPAAATPVTEQNPSVQNEPPAAVASPHAERLPKTGFGLDLLAFAAAGAMIGRKRLLRRDRVAQKQGSAL